jgi:hypothetical protein
METFDTLFGSAQSLSKIACGMSGSQGGEYEDNCFLEYDATSQKTLIKKLNTCS